VVKDTEDMMRKGLRRSAARRLDIGLSLLGGLRSCLRSVTRSFQLGHLDTRTWQSTVCIIERLVHSHLVHPGHVHVDRKRADQHAVLRKLLVVNELWREHERVRNVTVVCLQVVRVADTFSGIA